MWIQNSDTTIWSSIAHGVLVQASVWKGKIYFQMSDCPFCFRLSAFSNTKKKCMKTPLYDHLPLVTENICQICLACEQGVAFNGFLSRCSNFKVHSLSRMNIAAFKNAVGKHLVASSSSGCLKFIV